MNKKSRHGWLIPNSKKRLGPPKVLEPLLAVVQHNNGKVHPVMGYHKLNEHIDAFTANVDRQIMRVAPTRYKCGHNLKIIYSRIRP